MHDVKDRRFPPGRQPYDVLNGMRIGALVGVILGAVITAIWDLGVWPILIGAVVFGLVGFTYERRALERDRASSSSTS